MARSLLRARAVRVPRSAPRGYNNRMSADTETAAPGLAEMRDLKMTVFALREELEAARRDTADAVRQGVSGANAEIAQLKATIGALRDELQEWPIRRDEAARLAQAANLDEIKQLKSGIAALRDTLEAAKSEQEAAVRQAVISAQDEIAQLQATVRALREQLQPHPPNRKSRNHGASQTDRRDRASARGAQAGQEKRQPGGARAAEAGGAAARGIAPDGGLRYAGRRAADPGRDDHGRTQRRARHAVSQRRRKPTNSIRASRRATSSTRSAFSTPAASPATCSLRANRC